MHTMKRLNQTLGLFLVLAGLSLAYVSAYRKLCPETPYGSTALEIDGAPARDLEFEAMHARIRDLEDDLAAREEELEDLANTLAGAIADRNEAIAILRKTGELPCVWWQEAGGVPVAEEVGDQRSEVGKTEGRGE